MAKGSTNVTRFNTFSKYFKTKNEAVNFLATNDDKSIASFLKKQGRKGDLTGVVRGIRSGARPFITKATGAPAISPRPPKVARPPAQKPKVIRPKGTKKTRWTKGQIHPNTWSKKFVHKNKQKKIIRIDYLRYYREDYSFTWCEFSYFASAQFLDNIRDFLEKVWVANKNQHVYVYIDYEQIIDNTTHIRNKNKLLYPVAGGSAMIMANSNKQVEINRILVGVVQNIQQILVCSSKFGNTPPPPVTTYKNRGQNAQPVTIQPTKSIRTKVNGIWVKRAIIG